MNTPKTLALLPIITLFLVIFISCGPAPSKESLKVLDSVSPENQKILFWYQSGSDEEIVINEIIEEFNLNNEFGIQVEGINKSYRIDLWDTISGAEVKPDIFWITPDGEKGLPFRDEVVDLFPYLYHSEWGEDEAISADLLEILKNTFIGYLVKDSEWILPGIPILRDLSLLYCNLDLLKALGYSSPPGKQDEFRTICEASSILPEGEGLVFSPDTKSLLTLAFADGLIARDKEGVAIEDEERILASGEYLSSLSRSGNSVPVIERFAGQMEFSRGNHVFSLDASSGARYYKNSIEKSRNPFSWTVTPFPSGESEGTVGCWDQLTFLLPGTSEKQMAGWIFIKWCLTTSVQEKLAESAGIIPVNPEAGEKLYSKLDKDSILYKIMEISRFNSLQPFPFNQETRIFYELIDHEFLELLDLD